MWLYLVYALIWNYQVIDKAETISKWFILGPGPQGFVMDQPPPYPGPPIQQNQMQQSSVGEGYGSEYQKQPAFNPNAS